MACWRRTAHKNPDQIGDRWEGFTIISRDGNGPAVLTSGAPHWIGPIHTASVEEAKAVAAAPLAGRKAP